MVRNTCNYKIHIELRNLVTFRCKQKNSAPCNPSDANSDLRLTAKWLTTILPGKSCSPHSPYLCCLVLFSDTSISCLVLLWV